MEKLNNIVVQLSSHGKLVAERSAILRKGNPPWPSTGRSSNLLMQNMNGSHTIKPEIQTTVTSVCSVHPICMAWTAYPNTSKSRLRTRWPTLDALARTTSNFWALSLQANHIKTTVWWVVWYSMQVNRSTGWKKVLLPKPWMLCDDT